MLLQVLGTAAGGGLPQWNCACPGCAGARAHPHRRRRHASLALRADEGRWFLVNATPDIGDQIEDSHELRPGPGPRESPVVGVILTDAELDHTLGIARLREADGFDILATRPVRDALLGRLRLGEVIAPCTRIEWRELGRTAVPLAKGGTVEMDAVPISAKRPRYAADSGPPAGPDDPTWVVAKPSRWSWSGRGPGRSRRRPWRRSPSSARCSGRCWTPWNTRGPGQSSQHLRAAQYEAEAAAIHQVPWRATTPGSPGPDSSTTRTRHINQWTPPRSSIGWDSRPLGVPRTKPRGVRDTAEGCTGVWGRSPPGHCPARDSRPAPGSDRWWRLTR
jgi:hypothetical protein